jgi:hypothetical protein
MPLHETCCTEEHGKSHRLQQQEEKEVTEPGDE